MKVERLLAIVIKMINNKRVTAGELAEYFEVSIKTIQRDIERISFAGIPVVSYKGKNGGYGLMEDYLISKSYFTQSEKDILLTAVEGVSRAYNHKDFQNIAEKLMLLQKNNEGKKKSDFIIDLSYWGSNDKNKRRIDILKTSIENRNAVEFLYIDINGVSTQRIIEPLSIILKVSSWYLYGYCRVREDFRLFKLSRIRELIKLEERFQPKNIPESIDFYKDTREKVKILLKFNSKALSRLDNYFEIEDLQFNDDGFIYVTAEFPEDEWIYEMILSFGDNVEILEPYHIREVIKNKASRIYGKYI
ncbi:helix-turn-helix transcriptional regulator [Clostridium polynesiense]|uniref:helix-turn-helix transcriptional regulator n=1 Tax=Clostridium polynesiense TaxID=1325933 RepID=UPI00058F99B2|nr:YafY family protein [Clostridium polynesiense]